jgi:hypothetical protein
VRWGRGAAEGGVDVEAEDVECAGDGVADEGDVEEYGCMWKSMGICGTIDDGAEDAM